MNRRTLMKISIGTATPSSGSMLMKLISAPAAITANRGAPSKASNTRMTLISIILRAP